MPNNEEMGKESLTDRAVASRRLAPQLHKGNVHFTFTRQSNGNCGLINDTCFFVMKSLDTPGVIFFQMGGDLDRTSIQLKKAQIKTWKGLKANHCQPIIPAGFLRSSASKTPSKKPMLDFLWTL